MTLQQIKNISTLIDYCKQNNRNLSIRNYNNIDFVYSYNTPVAYIQDKKLYIIDYFKYSITTSKHLYYLRKISNGTINKLKLYDLCVKNCAPTGVLLMVCFRLNL